MQRFEQAQSYNLEMTTRFSDSTTTTQTYVYEAPETVYTKDRYEDSASESLTIGDQVYTFIRGEWYHRRFEGASPLTGTPLGDQQTRDEFVTDSEFLGQEDSEGTHLLRFRNTLDLSFLSAAFPSECMGQEFDIDFGPATVDVWVDSETVLPSRLDWSAEITFNGESMSYEIEGRYSNYNGPHSIPSPPVNPKDFPDFGFEDCFSPA